MVAHDEVSDSGVVVVYALADVQYLVPVKHEEGLTARDAVMRSGLLDRFPEIAQQPLVLGMYGREIAPHVLLEPGARVEICRALQRDPREMRRIMTSQGMVVGQRSTDQT
jgi:putative ubiquitin-RnfH superfamily antitoxin RatB of RatAB toxin-antitoxin module